MNIFVTSNKYVRYSNPKQFFDSRQFWNSFGLVHCIYTGTFVDTTNHQNICWQSQLNNSAYASSISLFMKEEERP